MRALIETWHQECALSRYGSGRLARAARSAHPGSDTTTNPTQEPDNVRVYRIVKD